MFRFACVPLACLVATLLAIAPPLSAATTVLVEAEAFDQHGGWKLDQQSMDQMGSPYLLAHGLGRPVADAETTVALPEPGEYRLWVRTRNWLAPWKPDAAPGRFQVTINGRPLPEVFGATGDAWSWHEGGAIYLGEGEVRLGLRDLTGFEGRCDAIVLSSDPQFTPPADAQPLAAWRATMLGVTGEPKDRGEYDLVVVGGGVAGCCTAISAARLGLSVALVQDRPVLGGNASSEVRVGISGRLQQEPYPLLGEIVVEMNASGEMRPPNRGPAEEFRDDRKRELVEAEENIRLFLREYVDRVETDEGRITAVVSRHTGTGQRSRFVGRWFADCTGDGTVGYLAGADFEMTERGHLGSSNLWAVRDTGRPAPFPRCPWGLDLEGKTIPTDLRHLGEWRWESGFDRDTIRDVEAIRDHNLRAMYSVWDRVKNVERLYPNHELVWAAYISGKRESRRLLGDVVLTKEHILEGHEFPDRCVTLGWAIDLHYPDPKYKDLDPDNPFLSTARFERFEGPYAIPYRCFYSRNVPNLFMAGRDISVTHEALGSVRVQATTGMMGEVVGRAARVCKTHDGQPRDVYQKHLDELKELLTTSLSKQSAE